MFRRQHEEISYRDLVEALRTLCRDRATGHMFIHTDSNHSARIALSDGVIKSVTLGRFQGQEALGAIRKVRSAKFSFSEVAYEVRSRRPLPATEEILAYLAGDTELQEAGRGGVPAETGGPSADSRSESESESSGLSAAARLFGGRSAGARASLDSGRGAERSASDVTERLRMLRPAARPSDAADHDDDALARELFGVGHRETERGLRKVAGGAAGASRSFAPDSSTRGAPARSSEHGIGEPSDASAPDLSASTPGAELGSSPDGDASRESSGVTGLETGIGDARSAAADAIAFEDFSSELQNPFGADDGQVHGLDSMAGSQRVFGAGLVDLVVEHLSKSMGPAASAVVVELRNEIEQVSEAAQLDAILWQLGERIGDVEAAFDFHTEVMEAAFG